MPGYSKLLDHSLQSVLWFVIIVFCVDWLTIGINLFTIFMSIVLAAIHIPAYISFFKLERQPFLRPFVQLLVFGTLFVAYVWVNIGAYSSLKIDGVWLVVEGDVTQHGIAHYMQQALWYGSQSVFASYIVFGIRRMKF